MSSSLTVQEKADLMALASSAQPGMDPALLDHLAELAGLGCQAQDVKDYLRCLVARSGTGGTAAAVSTRPAR
jgi:hypothetical protein